MEKFAMAALFRGRDRRRLRGARGNIRDGDALPRTASQVPSRPLWKLLAPTDTNSASNQPASTIQGKSISKRLWPTWKIRHSGHLYRTWSQGCPRITWKSSRWWCPRWLASLGEALVHRYRLTSCEQDCLLCVLGGALLFNDGVPPHVFPAAFWFHFAQTVPHCTAETHSV